MKKYLTYQLLNPLYHISSEIATKKRKFAGLFPACRFLVAIPEKNTGYSAKIHNLPIAYKAIL
jgi:hypothetical protein